MPRFARGIPLQKHRVCSDNKHQRKTVQADSPHLDVGEVAGDSRVLTGGVR